MREIKFNFYNTSNKIYTKWEESNAGMPMATFYTHDHLVFLQFTGLKDRYGKDIYEGDVILIEGEQELDYGFTADWNHMAVVKWDEINTGFYLDVIDKQEVTLGEDAHFNYDYFPLRKWEDEEWDVEYSIKGNVYEHSHVLEGESNV